MKNLNDVYSIITDRIIQQLNQGVIPWKQSWATVGPPANLISKQHYRGINSFLLACAKFSSPWFLTFKQCSQLGGTIKKGESGLPVIYWKVSYKTPSGALIPSSQVSPADKLIFTPVYLLRYYKVWNVLQCDNISGKVPVHSQTIHIPVPEAEQIVSGYRSSPPIIHGGSQAYYAPLTDYIQMPNPSDFFIPQHYYATLFHEMIHSTGHKSRLSRSCVTDRTVTFASVEYSKEELIAEIGACYLLNHAGFNSDNFIPDSAAYINTWIKKLQSDPKLIIAASAKAQQASDFILNIKAETQY